MRQPALTGVSFKSMTRATAEASTKPSIVTRRFSCCCFACDAFVSYHSQHTQAVHVKGYCHNIYTVHLVNIHILHAADGWGSISTEDAGVACRQATVSPWSLQDGFSQHPIHEAAAHACDQSGIGHFVGCHQCVIMLKLRIVRYQWLSIWLMCMLHDSTVDLVDV